MMKSFSCRAIALSGLICTAVGALGATEIHISPSGQDTAAGTESAPFRTLARAKEAALASQPGPGKEAITIWVHGGRYPSPKTIQFGPKMAGSKEFPVRIRAVKGETPVFDAGVNLPIKGAQRVTDPAQLSRLPAIARGKAIMLKITNPQHQKILKNASSRLSIDGRMMSVARYPNTGFAHISKIHDKGAIYARGRTKGPVPKWSIEKPVGGTFSILNKDISAWERELKAHNKLTIRGYLAYDWYKQTHPVGKISDGKIQLASYSRYGILSREKIPRRFYASNLLCELDAPGEFYFDESDSTLFFLPPSQLERSSSISLWGGPGPFLFKGATHTSLEGLVVEGVGRGPAAVMVESGHHIQLAGCTIRNCSRPAVVINGGTDNGLLSCDIYDVASHLTLQGGDVRSLTPARNFAINCHFTQVSASDYYGGIRIRGVAQTFRNNLVHNCPGQIITFGGCNHHISNNEIFNIGYEEGDGGAIYSGASAWSWGNRLDNNFLHHLMCLPQAHPRGGIYPDDGDMGDSITRNVFYKAAHRAVLINGGGGHTVKGNIFLNGHIGIYNTQASALKRIKMVAEHNAGKLTRGDKSDWIWRTEKVIGKEGWNRPPWSTQFPQFRKIMNQEKMRHFPIDCEFTGNRFHGNSHNIEWRVGGGAKGVKNVDEVEFIQTSDNREINLSLFRNPQALDFRYRSPASRQGMPQIRFAAIGLKKDSYRLKPPKPSQYRKAVLRHFKDRKSYDSKAIYNPETVNDEVYFNTGRLFLNSGAMIH